MPLVPSVLANGFLDIMQNPTNDVQDFVERTAQAFHAYASQVVPPSTTSAAAKQDFKTAMLSASTYEAAFVAYVLKLSAGMAPTFAGVPPAGPLLFTGPLVSSFEAGANQQAIANQMATVIDGWMRTGTWTNVGSGATGVFS